MIQQGWVLFAIIYCLLMDTSEGMNQSDPDSLTTISSGQQPFSPRNTDSLSNFSGSTLLIIVAMIGALLITWCARRSCPNSWTGIYCHGCRETYASWCQEMGHKSVTPFPVTSNPVNNNPTDGGKPSMGEPASRTNNGFSTNRHGREPLGQTMKQTVFDKKSAVKVRVEDPATTCQVWSDSNVPPGELVREQHILINPPGRLVLLKQAEIRGKKVQNGKANTSVGMCDIESPACVPATGEDVESHPTNLSSEIYPRGLVSDHPVDRLNSNTRTVKPINRNEENHLPGSAIGSTHLCSRGHIIDVVVETHSDHLGRGVESKSLTADGKKKERQPSTESSTSDEDPESYSSDFEDSSQTDTITSVG